MELLVIRKYFRETYTIGKFYADGKPLCETLEDKARELQDLNHDGDFMDPGEGKVYGETAIPCGRYKVGLIYWKKRNGLVPLLFNVPGFTGILIHSGSNPLHTEGCILVGENKIKGGLVNSPYWATTITQMIKDAIDRKEEVFITIKM